MYSCFKVRDWMILGQMYKKWVVQEIQPLPICAPINRIPITSPVSTIKMTEKDFLSVLYIVLHKKIYLSQDATNIRSRAQAMIFNRSI